jgi:hypothetical protein
MFLRFPALKAAAGCQRPVASFLCFAAVESRSRETFSNPQKLGVLPEAAAFARWFSLATGRWQLAN